MTDSVRDVLVLNTTILSRRKYTKHGSSFNHKNVLL